MRLIDADVLLNSIFKSCNTTEATINNAPTIDAVPVVRGKWIRGGANDMHGFDFHCSECNKSFRLGSLAAIYDVEREWIHCPNCGAKMDGERRIDDA